MTESPWKMWGATKDVLLKDENFATSKQIPFDVEGVVQCSLFSLYMHMSRITSQTTAALIHKEYSIHC